MNIEARCKEGVLCTSMFIFCLLALLSSGCAGTATFVPTDTSAPPSPIVINTAIPTIMISNTTTPACLEGLTFRSDVTIPDNSTVPAGNLLDKQWLVQNSGTCNWDNRYRLRLISGNALGASPEQALYPARAGTEAIIKIIFTAPSETGSYTSEWQAFDGNGVPFGDSFFIKIIVQS
jgi:hypothetical protein